MQAMKGYTWVSNLFLEPMQARLNTLVLNPATGVQPSTRTGKQEHKLVGQPEAALVQLWMHTKRGACKRSVQKGA